MAIETWRALFGWATLFNFGLVTVWFLLFVYARGWIYRFHGRWFTLSQESFHKIHYGGMAAYKLFTWFFCFVPYLVLRFCL